jgi:hypothetical protein
MAKTLSLKNRKRRRDKATAYYAGLAPKGDKVALERSKKAKTKNAFRAK